MADPDRTERLARRLSAETLVDVRTVRRYLAGHRVQRSTHECLERAKKALTSTPA
jgi:hypothetical protein